MGLFDSLLGGVVGAEMATVVNGLIQQHGGISGIVSQLERQGLGDTVKSWVGNGANAPISTDQVHQVLGSDTIRELAEQMGVSPDVIATKLADLLPKAVDHLTPNGTLPS